MGDWNAKYAPQCIAQMIGPQGTPQTLLRWLKAWKSDTRQKSVLITGPSGCGKTLLARLACREAGIDNFLELNCINKRSKKTIEALRDAFMYRPVLSFVARPSSGSAAAQKRTLPGAVVVDEIDACDEGGLPELLTHIRKSKVPVICIAGDGYNKSLKTLAASSLVLRMLKPSADQIAGRLVWICSQEKGVKPISPGAAKALANACNCDVRQAILELYMSSKSGTFSFARNDEGLICDRPLGIFEIVPKLFPPAPLGRPPAPHPPSLALAERMHLMDKTLVPLMVAENYVKAPALQKDPQLTAEIAESISFANALEGGMFKEGAWGTGDAFSHFAAIRPVALAGGGPLLGKAEFPSVMTKLNAFRKAEKQMHDMSLRMTASHGGRVPYLGSRELQCETMLALSRKYVGTYARICKSAPKCTAAAADIVAAEMDDYNLDRFDWDAIAASATFVGSGKSQADVVGISAISSTAKTMLSKAFAARKKGGPLKRQRTADGDDSSDSEGELSPKKHRV